MLNVSQGRQRIRPRQAAEASGSGMDASIERALQRDLTIDITTKGKKSGADRKIEIWFHNIDGRLFITGLPGNRHWYDNMAEHPNFLFHLKESVTADLNARAEPITNPELKRPVIREILKRIDHDMGELEDWVVGSPLVEVFVGGYGSGPTEERS